MHGGVEVQFHAFITSVLDGLARFATKPLKPPGKICVRLYEPHSWTAQSRERRRQFQRKTWRRLHSPVKSMRFLYKTSILLFVFVIKSSLQDCVGVECRM